MSFTITAQAIPSVANSDWETIDEYLLHRQGDWKILRGGLIHLVCDRVTRDGGPVSRLEEFLLCEFYRQPPVHAGFHDALRLVRAELGAWPEEARNLFEHLLAQDRDFPVGGPHFPADFDRLRVAARKAAAAPEPPRRDLGRFRRTPRRLLSQEGDEA
jgi:hypothetical protein